jgi:hypothetical protein
MKVTSSRQFHRQFIGRAPKKTGEQKTLSGTTQDGRQQPTQSGGYVNGVYCSDLSTSSAGSK